MRKDSPSSPPSWLALIACACTPKQAKTVNQNTYTLVLFCFDPPCVHSSRCTRLEIEADERPCAKTVLQGPPPGWLWAELPVCIFTKLVHRQPRVLLQVCLTWYPAAAAPASASHRSPLRRPHRFPRSERAACLAQNWIAQKGGRGLGCLGGGARNDSHQVGFSCVDSRGRSLEDLAWKKAGSHARSFLVWDKGMA